MIYRFGCLDIEPHEDDIYCKIIEKLKNDKEITEDDKKNILKIINEMIYVCDEYEIKILEIIKQKIKK